MSAAMMSTTMSTEERVKQSKRAVTTSGMRVGRTGAIISSAGVAALIWSTRAPDLLQNPARFVGVLAMVFGILPFMLGWKQSKAGSPFLRALNAPTDVEALMMEEKPLAGDRRSLSVLLGDGTSQSVALSASEAGDLFTLVKELNPAAQCEVLTGAQRHIATLKP